MYEIKVKANFSAAHNLREYKGKCENLHGHNWNVEAVFFYKKLAKDGMAVDFRDAKDFLNKAIDLLDHAYLNDIGVFRKINPTSENLAKYIYDSIKKRNASIGSVCVWESDNACATYHE
jgi:6-pyruvoyltetrahydropterin/6-carboxytetrahydropterin synthase